MDLIWHTLVPSRSWHGHTVPCDHSCWNRKSIVRGFQKRKKVSRSLNVPSVYRHTCMLTLASGTDNEVLQTRKRFLGASMKYFLKVLKIQHGYYCNKQNNFCKFLQHIWKSHMAGQRERFMVCYIRSCDLANTEQPSPPAYTSFHVLKPRGTLRFCEFSGQSTKIVAVPEAVVMYQLEVFTQPKGDQSKARYILPKPSMVQQKQKKGVYTLHEKYGNPKNLLKMY